MCVECTWSVDEGERGRDDLWGGGERGDRTGRGPAEGDRKDTIRVTPRPAALPGNRLSFSIVRGDTTGLRPDVEEIRYGASVGILASQLLRHCATAHTHGTHSTSMHRDCDSVGATEGSD